MPSERSNEEQRLGKAPRESDEEAEKTITTEAVQSLGHDAAEAKKDIATAALQTLSLEDQAVVLGQIVTPSQKVTDRQAQWMSAAGAILLVVSLAPVGAAIVRLFNTPTNWDNAPTEGEISQTIGFYLPIILTPMVLLFAAALLLVVGYLLMRAGYAATKELIPEHDRVMVSEILRRADPKEAMDEYVRLRSLTGLSGFFTKMKLSGLPLATITLTLIFTFLAIWADAFFDLAKLTLGVFLGSYVQQRTGPERQP